MMRMKDLKWDNGKFLQAIGGIGIDPMIEMVEIIDAELEKVGDKPQTIYYVNRALAHMLDELNRTLDRVYNQYKDEIDMRYPVDGDILECIQGGADPAHP